MHWRRAVAILVVLLTTVVGLIGVTNIAHAAPSAGHSIPSFTAPREGAKVTLGDTSIDGPSISVTYAPKTVLAWTGTDAAHHLNVMTSTDGLHYSNKHILPETSLWRPAVAFIDTGRGDPYGTIVIAWTGTDAAHTLNVEFIHVPDFVVQQKITYWGETSFTAPALATINGDINSDVYLSWAGTDAAHTLNIMRHTTNPQSNHKYTLWGWSSISRPSLSTDQSSGSAVSLILAWTNTANHLAFATSTDGARWTMPSSSPLPQQSAWAPSMIAFYSTTMPNHWLAWTGSGSTSTRNINVKYTQHFPSWSDANASVTLGETAISSPALAYNWVSPQVLLAWTGTDALHRLNVAVVYVAA